MRKFLLSLIAIAATFPLHAADRPNIVVLLADDMGFGDIGEQHNLIAEHPEKARALRALLDEQIANGRSTPGPKQKNDVESIIVDKFSERGE